MHQKNTQLLKKVDKSILTEKMHGMKMNGKNQTIFNGLRMPRKNM